MAGILESIAEKYNYVIHDLADPRTADWWGVQNPMVVISIASAYLYFCKSLGPRLMSNRPAFELKTVLMLYNIFQILFSLFLVNEGVTFCICIIILTIVNNISSLESVTGCGVAGIIEGTQGAAYVLSKDYNLACEPIDYSNNPRALRVAAASWFYYFAKITELLDTVFFVLRKKNNQVTFLHVYHHTIMTLVVWVGVKYFPGGHTTFMGFLNSIVHVIMYTYYFIAGLGPEYQKYVWWKKHVTLIQLIQFLIIFAHNGAVFFYPCTFPKLLNILCLVNSTAFLYMFGKFYINSYKKNNTNKTVLDSKKVTPISSKVNNSYGRRKVAEKSR